MAGTRTSTALSLLVVLAIATIVMFIDFPDQTMLWAEVQNASHAPAFGVIAIALLVLLRNTLSQDGRSRWIHYSLALGISICIGVATEVVQYFIGKDAAFIDVVRDALGATSFLAMYFTFDPNYVTGGRNSSQKIACAFRSTSVLILLTAFVSLGFCAASYFWRNYKFPLICDFGSLWSVQFVKLEDATLTRVVPPIGWPDRNGGRVGHLQLGLSEYPDLTIEEPYPDWHAYTALCLDLYSDGPDTLHLSLRIDDIHHNYEYTDRFTGRIMVVPGPNHVRIPLEQVRRAPVGRETDMVAIRRIIIFAHKPQHLVTLYLDRLWLE